EILPFCSASLVGNLAATWADLCSADPRQAVVSRQLIGGAPRVVYDKYDRNLTEFGVALEGMLDSIEKSAQMFYNQHFGQTGEKPLKITLKLTGFPRYDRNKYVLAVPKIGLGISIGDDSIYRPQSFQNEAKLTQIALAIRFGATKANFHESSLKLLVLDDLLISLDMSNRMQVIKIILADEDFTDYQKIIMTHDRGFYREIRRQIGVDKDNWVFQRLHLENGKSPSIVKDPDRLEWADALFQQGHFDESSLQLRKASEEFLRDFVGKAFCADRFVSLSKLLKEAQRKNDTFLLSKLFVILERWESEGNGALDHLLPPDMDDIKGDTSLSPEETAKHCQRRAELRNLLRELHGSHRNTGRIFEQMEQMKDRILNPAAHAGDTPLYSSEIEDALRLVEELRDVVSLGNA
ncbi:MAG: hypothetical protein DRR42_15010, partial [Gammaproteobacteria bacterium]